MGIKNFEAIFYIGAFVALVTFFTEQDIYAVIAMGQVVGIISSFGVRCGENEITIFEITRAIGVFGIEHSIFGIGISMRSRNFFL